MRAVICIAVFASIAICQPPDPEQLFRQAVDAQQRGDFPAAIRDYERLLELRPDSVDALANLGAALVHVNRFDEAVSRYRAALKLDPANSPIHLNLGLAFYKKGDFQSAAGEFGAVHSANPNDVRTATLLGDCDLRLGHPEQAATITVPLAASHPEDLDLAFVAGSALIQTGKRREGLVLVEHVAKLTNGADAYSLAGSTWLDINEFDRARQDLEKAFQLNPNLPGIHTSLGMLFDKSGEPAKAEAELRKALDLNPSDFQANLYLGAILYKRRDLQAARPYLQRALAIIPTSGLARYEFALLENAAGEVAAAATDLETVVRQSPDWLEPHVELAALYYKMGKREEGAKQRQIVDRLTAEQQQRGPQ